MPSVYRHNIGVLERQNPAVFIYCSQHTIIEPGSTSAFTRLRFVLRWLKSNNFSTDEYVKTATDAAVKKRRENSVIQLN